MLISTTNSKYSNKLSGPILLILEQEPTHKL